MSTFLGLRDLLVRLSFIGVTELMVTGNVLVLHSLMEFNDLNPPYLKNICESDGIM